MTGKEVIKLLRKNGFELARITGSHHIMVGPDGRVVTVPVHGSKDLKKGTDNAILKQAGLR